MYPETKTLNTMLCTSVEPRRYVAEWSPADWSGPGLYRVLQIIDLKKKFGVSGLYRVTDHVLPCSPRTVLQPSAFISTSFRVLRDD